MNQLDKSNDHGRNCFSNLYVKVVADLEVRKGVAAPSGKTRSQILSR